MCNPGSRKQQKAEILGIPRGRPNPLLNSDPARIIFRSFSSFRFLDSAHRLGAGGAG
jgi:hypothetical protein